MKICICSSMAFYEKFNLLKIELEKMGYEVITPPLEFESKGEDTSVETYINELGGIENLPLDHEFWKRKGDAIKNHYNEILNSDCVLVTNYEKRDVENYIGPNSFIEMGFAFVNNKKIFILNDLPKGSPYLEEIKGMNPIIINQDLSLIQ
jgi:hypothetical protein